jgi:hypothetical protein
MSRPWGPRPRALSRLYRIFNPIGDDQTRNWRPTAWIPEGTLALSERCGEESAVANDLDLAGDGKGPLTERTAGVQLARGNRS